jgi:uncharacterized membrane protein (DUF485 family)
MQTATMLTLRKRWIWRGSIQFVTINMAFIVALNIAMSFDYLLAEPISALLIFVGLGLLFGIAGLVLMAIWLAIVMPRLAKKQYEQLALEEKYVEISFDDDILRLKDHIFDMAVQWTSLLRWTESNTLLLLYRSDHCAHYLPKELIDSEDLETIRQHLNRANVPFF